MPPVDRETADSRGARGAHIVQLFDSVQSLSEEVAEFLAAGLVEGERTLVVIAAQRWSLIAERLVTAGCQPDEAIASGQLIVRDSEPTLRQLIRFGRPDAELFDRHVGRLVRELTADGDPLRIYGEMVDVLATQGEYHSAILLEELWNGLSARHAFKLFCGYASASFDDPRRAASLRTICGAHSHVRSDARDLLASFLVKTHVERPANAGY